jgi:hypothetical protein
MSAQKSKWSIKAAPKTASKQQEVNEKSRVEHPRFNVHASEFRPRGWTPEHALEAKKDFMVQQLIKQRITLTPEQIKQAERDPESLTKEIIKQLSAPVSRQNTLELRFDACMQMIDDMIGLGDEL